MLAITRSVAHLGAQASVINIEVDVHNGLPGISIVGLPGKTIEEARERIRSAIRNSDLKLPPRKITINLAPADIAKSGTGYDLAITLGILQATGQIPILDKSICCVGELGLDGEIRPAQDTFASVLAAQDLGFSIIMTDSLSKIDSSLCDNLTILRPQNLRAAYQHFVGEKIIPSWHGQISQNSDFRLYNPVPDLTNIHGQATAKRALEISMAGKHNLLLVGSPGVGKSLLAHAAINLMPQASRSEQREIQYLHSLAGQPAPSTPSHRPFRSPHHTSSAAALTGGGTRPKPGEISLAHNGVLFLDEIAEFQRPALEALRQPLENNSLVISRAAQSVEFPAKTTLIGAMNPCPCGYYQSQRRVCNCSAAAIQHYQAKLSGPLLDRFDIICWVDDIITTNYKSPPESSNTVHKRIENASANPTIESIDENAKLFFNEYSSKSNQSWRGLMQINRLAQTIAKLNGVSSVSAENIQEAIYYRQSLISP